LDGWTSENSHTVEYLAVQIEEVIKKVKPERISAIVLDNATNIRKARKIINEKYPKIESVQCILHCINLIACDIVSHNFADRLLRRVNILLTTFFRNSHMAESGIKGGGLKSYCITRWTTSSESVNSVLNLKPVLEKMKKRITNMKITRLINLEKPIRRTINGEIIPNDNVIVLIENIWIENEIDLSNDLILNGIGNIPKDLDDDFIDNEKNNNDENIVLTDDEIVDNTN
ncbi:16506_t:CDS:2, partial [Rhizophagus irregularis]